MSVPVYLLLVCLWTVYITHNIWWHYRTRVILYMKTIKNYNISDLKGQIANINTVYSNYIKWEVL